MVQTNTTKEKATFKRIHLDKPNEAQVKFICDNFKVALALPENTRHELEPIILKNEMGIEIHGAFSKATVNAALEVLRNSNLISKDTLFHTTSQKYSKFINSLIIFC